jgi:Domain of unknown function (DUF4405)
MKITREWATSATIGVFLLMAITGVLMFFHLASGLQKTVHEWAGWVMVAAVVAHVVVNWMAFKRYLVPRGKTPAIVGVFATVLLVSFFVKLPGGGQPSTPGLAIAALSKAPLPALAAVYGKSPEQARSELAAAGIVLAGDDATLASVIANDRERLGQALAALARKPAP